MGDDYHQEKTVILSKRIFKFYERGLKFFPLAIMATHWYGIFDYHHQPRQIMVVTDENEYCIMFLYVMSYVFPLLSMLPASYFFRLCWIWRIPFVYLMGVNVTRFYFGSWLISEEMVHVDFFLVFLTLMLYGYAFVQLSCTRQHPARFIGKLFRCCGAAR